MNSSTILIIILSIAIVASLGLALYWRAQVGKTYNWYKNLQLTITQLNLTIKNLTELYTLELDNLFTSLYEKQIFETREAFDAFVEEIVEKTVEEFNTKYNIDLHALAENDIFFNPDDEEE